MKKLILSVAVCLSATVSAQQFKVVSLQEVNSGTEMPTFHPRFMPDGKSLMVCSENYQGLGIIDVENSKYTHLTDMVGAGYKAAISDDGKLIITRNMDLIEQRETLYSLDIATKSLTTLATDIEHVNTINVSGRDYEIGINGKLLRRSMDGNRSIKSIPSGDVMVTEEDLKMVVYIDGVRNVVDPVSTPEHDVNYCWTSLSPNKEKLLFVAGNDAYVSNLDGSALVCLGAIHAPVWRGNDYVVAMEDHDDGHVFTASDIVIVRANGSDYQKLQGINEEINMFPSVSPDGNRIAYHTLDGKIYIMTIEEK